MGSSPHWQEVPAGSSTHRHLVVHVLLVEVEVAAGLPQVQLGNVWGIYQVVAALKSARTNPDRQNTNHVGQLRSLPSLQAHTHLQVEVLPEGLH